MVEVVVVVAEATEADISPAKLPPAGTLEASLLDGVEAGEGAVVTGDTPTFVLGGLVAVPAHAHRLLVVQVIPAAEGVGDEPAAVGVPLADAVQLGGGGGDGCGEGDEGDGGEEE